MDSQSYYLALDSFFKILDSVAIPPGICLSICVLIADTFLRIAFGGRLLFSRNRGDS